MHCNDMIREREFNVECKYRVNVNNNHRIIGCRQNVLHRMVSSQQHGFLVDGKIMLDHIDVLLSLMCRVRIDAV